jgi:hypothetical protein
MVRATFNILKKLRADRFMRFIASSRIDSHSPLMAQNSLTSSLVIRALQVVVLQKNAASVFLRAFTTRSLTLAELSALLLPS